MTLAIARYGSRSATTRAPVIISISTRPAAKTSIAGDGTPPAAASGDM